MHDLLCKLHGLSAFPSALLRGYRRNPLTDMHLRSDASSGMALAIGCISLGGCFHEVVSLWRNPTCSLSSPRTGCATSAKRSSSTTSTSGATAIPFASSSSTTPARPIRRSIIRCSNRRGRTTKLYYVGPREKEQFLAYLNGRLRDKRLESLVKNLFRPSYGGNRNYTLMYTLGGLMVSSDDDMRPYTLMEDSPESLAADEVCRGKLLKAGHNGYTPQILRHPRVLPRRAGQTCRPGAGQLRARRGACRYRDGVGDQRDQGTGAGELPDAAARPPGRRRDREDGPDVPLRHQRHRRHRLRRYVPRRRTADEAGRPQRRVRAGQLPPRADQEELAHGLRRRRLRQHLRPAAVLPHPAALRGLHLSALGPAGRRRSPPTSMPPRTTPRATTCATRQRRRSSTRSWPT